MVKNGIKSMMNAAYFPTDAHWSPHWFSAGWSSWSEDATLLPFWEQCHISQQVWILQPAWKNQHQPYNIQVRCQFKRFIILFILVNWKTQNNLNQFINAIVILEWVNTVLWCCCLFLAVHIAGTKKCFWTGNI